MSRRGTTMGNYTQSKTCPGAWILGTKGISVTDKHALSLNKHTDEIEDLKRAVNHLSQMVHDLMDERDNKNAS